jgi:hypothetical protein
MQRTLRPRRLESLDDRELAEYWRVLALYLVPQLDPISHRLPPAHQAHYDAVRAEFERRGVQLALF